MDWFCCLCTLRRRLASPLAALDQTPPVMRYKKYHSTEDVRGVSGIAGACITLNLIMGSGFLTLPRAFVNGGLILSTCILASMITVVIFTVLFEVEVMCRAEAVLKYKLNEPLRATKERVRALSLSPVHKKTTTGSSVSTERDALLAVTRTERHPPLHQNGDHNVFRLTAHAYQLAELCDIFGGKAVRVAYDWTISIYVLSTLWGYSAVFAQTMAAYVNLSSFTGTEENSVSIWILVYAIIVVPMSILDVKEQAHFQILMTILRFVIAGIMTGSVLWAVTQDTSPFKVAPVPDVALWNWSGLGAIVPSTLFAVMLNSSVPTVVQSLGHKPDIIWVVKTAMACACILYGTIALSIGGYFGSSVSDMCNVMWEGFPNGTSGASMFATFLGHFIVIFPAIDVVSVYPLNVVVLANNIMAAVYGDRIDKAETDRVIVAVFRLLVAFPPIIMCLCIHKFGDIIDLAGTLAIPIALIFPPYLNILSQRACQAKFGHCETPYSSRFWSQPLVCWGLICLGTCMFTAQLLSYVLRGFVS